MSLALKVKAVTPKPIWSILKWAKRTTLRIATKTLQGALSLAGLNVAKKWDYYSPLPVQADLIRTQSQWNKPSKLSGVPYELAGMKERLASLFSRYGQELASLPAYEQSLSAGFGPGYPKVDALVLYTMIRELKPKRYLEVGSGLSTYYCSMAATANSLQGSPLSIHCIEPYPFAQLRSIAGIQLTQRLVQDVDLAEFQKLEAGDVLFIDSTHALKIGGDVAFLFLEALPLVNEGVYVHIHDIPFPYNIPYPAEYWILNRNWPMFWNEAMVVQAFLCGNESFEIHLSCPLIRHFDEQFLEKTIRGYRKTGPNEDTFSSLWIRRRVRKK